MLIVSKYHDYYDTAHNGFIDKSIVYQRTPVQTNDFLKERFDYFRTGIKGKKLDIEFPYVGGTLSTREYTDHKELFMVGFCGRFYIGLHYTKYDLRKCETTIDRYIYDYDEIIECLELKPDKKVSKPTRKWHYFGDYYNKFVDFYKKYQGVERFEMFIEHKCPIIYIGSDRRVVLDANGDRKVILNPILKDIEFFKIFDSKTAFDSVSTFISNVLTNPEKEPVMSDKVLIESHGFDYKFSFRKDPTKPWKHKKAK